ncbi:SH3 domain-containing protein [Streptomyces sp. NPDC051776]|uniref:SH3 domain-containing protein n=1 Tax=Streptomyces sp. NPDC051776 TaxID=3155414 RepID=UPI00341637B5
MRLGIAAVVAVISVGVGMSTAHADDRHNDSVPSTINDEGDTIVYGHGNSIAGRDNLVGSGHTAGTGHVVGTGHIVGTGHVVGTGNVAGTGNVTGTGYVVGGPGAEAPGTPARPYGRVVSPVGINLRERPTTNSPVRGTLAYGDEVGLDCKVRGQSINGNDLWYKLRDRTVWAAARYVQNFGDVPFCASPAQGLSDEDLEPIEQDWNSVTPLG